MPRGKKYCLLSGDTVIEQGAIGNALYIITHGKLGVYQTDEQGNEKLLAVLTDGDLFGEIGLLENSIRTATVRALEESTMLRLTQKTVLGLAQTYFLIYERLRNAR